jgi:hypothetical protein
VVKRQELHENVDITRLHGLGASRAMGGGVVTSLVVEAWTGARGGT